MKKITGDAEEKENLGQFPFPDIQELHSDKQELHSDIQELRIYRNFILKGGGAGGFYVSLFCNKL